MIEHVIEWSIRNRFLVFLLAAALTVAGVIAVSRTPMDAIPDLSENQVIVFADWMGRSPREIEDQVTYPLSRKLQGLSGVRAVRSSSEFNFSMITIIFEEGIDFYFARQRVTEKLAQANTFLPAGVVPYLAPDATALGQVFWYTVEPSLLHPVEPGRRWALNKFYIAPQLNAAAGVSDVAIVGGMPLEYQIDVRPEDLRSYNLTIGDLYSAVARSNLPAGGGVIQKNNAEYIVRGVGWIRDERDIENTVIKQVDGIPLYVKSVATVQLGTQFRRSVFEKNGNEVTGGAVLMRHGQNPLTVTQAVKDKILELQPGLPPGVHIVAAYDRTRLIHGAIHTLTEVMWHEMLIASIAILLILMHVRSVLVICVTLPLAVLSSFLLMWVLRGMGIIDIQANIMSLAGITISIGILVDQAIVMTENATHALKEHFGDRPVTGDTREIVIPACRTVGGPIFFSVLIMLISFIPVFMLTGREGKLFHPLAFTKRPGACNHIGAWGKSTAVDSAFGRCRRANYRRPGDDQERKRTAFELCDAQCSRPRHCRLCRRSQAGSCSESDNTRRGQHRLERRVRASSARGADPALRFPGGRSADFRHLVSHVSRSGRCSPDDARRA